MTIINANQVFVSKKRKSMPIAPCPNSVKQAFNVDKAYENGIFKIEPKNKAAMYDRCYLFEDVNYINKNKAEQNTFLTELMLWMNSMDVEFKITIANEYQSMDEFLESIRIERNRDQYPEIAEGIRQWQDSRIDETNPQVTTLRYLTVTATADTEENARVYLNAIESTIEEAFLSWGSRIVRLRAKERLKALQAIVLPGRKEEQEYICFPEKKQRRDWKNDILPRSVEQYRNFLVMGDTYVTVLFGHRYRKTVNSDSLIRNLTNVSYPSFLTMDFAPVDAGIVADKLAAAQTNNDKVIAEEIEQKRKAGIPAVSPSYPRERKKQKIEYYADRLDENDEKGFFMNLLVVITADSEAMLAERMREMQTLGKKEGVTLETCDFTQLKAWNTALPVGGRQVDYMRFFLSSSVVAFQPYYAQDIIEPGGYMLGMNRTTKHFILGDRKKLPNPHGIIVGLSGSGKSMFTKLTEIVQTLLATDDDIIAIDPQNEMVEVYKKFHGSYFDLTPKSGIYLNGFEVSQEVFDAPTSVKQEFIAAQTEYAKTVVAAMMKNITVTQEHDSIISRCTERMLQKIFSQKKLKKQPTLTLLREEIGEELKAVTNEQDEKLIRPIYNSLEEYTVGSSDMLAHPSNVQINNRLTGFGMSNVPENNWEAVMVTILHWLSIRMDYNKKLRRATHLIIDESQVVSKKPGSAQQLNNAVLTFRKFGGIVTMIMQNVTAALSNQTLTELYANCSYKCFFDQGGVDAQQLAEIHPFSAKEYNALGSGNVGQGVIVWNKKVVLFDSVIEKENVLYDTFNTDFHEKAVQAQSRRTPEPGTAVQAQILQMPEPETTEEGSLLSDSDRQLILDISMITDISVSDVMQILLIDAEKAELYLELLEREGALKKSGEDKYGKVM